MNLVTWDPYRELSSLQDRMNRIFGAGLTRRDRDEEMSLGACSVAVPISAPDGPVGAALGIVVPSIGRDRPRLVAALRVAAQGIGRSLGAGLSTE